MGPPEQERTPDDPTTDHLPWVSCRGCRTPSRRSGMVPRSGAVASRVGRLQVLAAPARESRSDSEEPGARQGGVGRSRGLIP